MDPSDGNAVQPVTDVRSAREILRPALVLWFVVSALHGVYALLWAYVAPSLSRDSMVPLILTELFSSAGAVVIAVFAWKDRRTFRMLARPGRGMVELCLLVGIVGSVLLTMWERGIPPDGSDLSPLVELYERLPIWGLMLTNAVMPAVFEELMYRGVILQRLRAVVSLPMAIAVQAMLFAVWHMDPVHLLPKFAFGCLAGFLCTAARALWPSILMHFLWNGWLVLAVHELI